jgi:hypothetical protein
VYLNIQLGLCCNKNVTKYKKNFLIGIEHPLRYILRGSHLCTMELPFAVNHDPSVNLRSAPGGADDSSLVTASSQGSLLQSDASFDPIPSIVSSPYAKSTQFAPYSTLQNTRDNDELAAVLSQYGVSTPQTDADYTYVNVCEADEEEVDIIIAPGFEGHSTGYPNQQQRGDVLASILNSEADMLLKLTQQANAAVERAADAKKGGNLQMALDNHTSAASLFKDAAMLVKEKDGRYSLAFSGSMDRQLTVKPHFFFFLLAVAMAQAFLLLSQTHAKSALTIKRIVKIYPSSNALAIREQIIDNNTQKERLRATVRGALNSRLQADISDSTFLGRASGDERNTSASPVLPSDASTTQRQDKTTPSSNPVDEMMELERELNSMDMALSMGNSIASLDVRTQNRMKNSIVDGSFMVVPPGSNSVVYQSNHAPSNRLQQKINPGVGTANVRARANRVQNLLDASAARPFVSQALTVKQAGNHGLESSWWGSSSSMTQTLASSVISMSSAGGRKGCAGNETSGTNNKQLLRLMDALKTLGDENSALLREVEGAEKARLEAQAAQVQMKRFKDDYTKRFEALKDALEKFRKRYPSDTPNETNPVLDSDFLKSSSASEQLQRQEQLIKSLTIELKKERDDNKKKDAALRKYETFYREVKARSAQKAAQRQKETMQQRQHPSNQR